MDNKNKRQKRLTVEELKQYKGLENLSEQEANEAIDTLEKYALLMYELFKKDQELKERIKNSKQPDL
ncbi:MAG: hypothetical protein QM534_17805 [Sediminibacterium sp.]|nr:hypothetical protein [Sediminibacterium sp.]